jgi:ribulose-5-phosphate 4-epimerase/fuculose-1-phosphate aldolase
VSTEMDELIDDLVSANRVLGHEGILDAYGHVSVRHPHDPGRYLLSRARSPEVVEASDIITYELDGSPVGNSSKAAPYLERFIHGAIYEARPDVSAICHNHAMSILPFGVSTSVQLRGVIHNGRFLGDAVPVWDIAAEFGEDTDLLVRDMTMGRSLAATLGDGSVALMRGHGSVVVTDDVVRLVSMCIGMDRNARVQMDATRLGSYTPLADREMKAEGYDHGRGGDNRAWEYFKRRASIQ